MLIIKIKTNSDPLLTMVRIYNTEILTIAGASYTIGNLFGGPYTLDGVNNIHNNWLNTALEAFINPVVSSNLLQRPTFAKAPMTAYIAAAAADVNGYEYLFGNPGINTRTTYIHTYILYFQTSQDSSPHSTHRSHYLVPS